MINRFSTDTTNSMQVPKLLDGGINEILDHSTLRKGEPAITERLSEFIGRRSDGKS